MIPEDFKVIEGARGKKLENAASRVIKRGEQLIARLDRIERYADKVAEKAGAQRYRHGELPIGGVVARSTRRRKGK